MPSQDSKPFWQNYLEHNVLLEGFAEKIRVYEVHIKVQPGTLFAIIKAVSAEGPKVAFTGGGSLPALSRAIQERIKAYPDKWRDDQFYKT